MSDLEPILRRILRKAEIMQLDAKTPTASADAAEIKQLALMAIKETENTNDEPIPNAAGGCPEDN